MSELEIEQGAAREIWCVRRKRLYSIELELGCELGLIAEFTASHVGFRLPSPSRFVFRPRSKETA